MSDADNQIRNLLHRYAEAVDRANFGALDELFAHAMMRDALGVGEPSPGTSGSAISATFGASSILYGDGTPRTRHIVTNSIVDVDEEAGKAVASSYLMTLQQVPGRSIEIIATVRYEDTFERVGDEWRFSERIFRRSSIDGVNRDFVGDMSRHSRMWAERTKK